VTVKTTRRRFLKTLVVGGGLLAAGSVVALVRTRGYSLPKEREDALLAFRPWQFIVLENVARRVVAPDREGDRSIPSADDVDVAGFADAYTAKMPDRLRKDLLRFFGYIEHLAPLRAGFGARFTRLGPLEQDKVLTTLETSGQDVLREGFAALKALVFMGYYKDPRTWKILGYEGPLVGRPESGW
jgi:hypothetical protein